MILDQFKLNNRSALVIGGNRGLGIEMAKALAEAEASVAVAARDSSRIEEAVSILEPLGEGKSLGVVCDVTDESSVNQTVNSVKEEFGSLDILINSAGINFRGGIDEVPTEDFQKVQDVNVTGTWLGCKAVTPIMKAQEYGRIINIASIFSIVGFADRTPYTASKGAVLNMTKALAVELAPWKITVNAILPGPFATEMNIPLLEDNEKYKAFVANIPLGRWGELTEIGGLALFLASDASSFCTGGAFSIDGGWTAK
ncbi:MAG: 2-deoxy-D-gluconate 3-dehydrogenase [Opitutaceae bacterium]|nr:2-deoxy-D-gluconate 3-dehydrogenase [Opitutaceae bacterium]|tara:strand:- start:515 stop:1282 length:768 start_codon:yes stop_codon:yes gene_type:complete